MYVLTVFRLEEVLSLPSRNVEGEPTFVVGMDNGAVLDAGCDKPITHSLNRFLGWGKKLMNLFLSPMFSKVG